jgi:two-component system NtrC family response regulator
MKKNLLIIEDEKSVAKQLRWGLSDEYEITIASDAKKGRQLLGSGAFPVATLDLGLPPHPDTPQEGFQLLEEIGVLAPETRIVVITGNAEYENALKAINLGAADFYAKPIDLDILRIILERTYHIHELEEENRRLLQQTNESGSLCDMIGVSPVMAKLFDRIRNASKTDYPVLITGSTGTGKEVAAQAIHKLSARAEKPLVAVNCGAIPENLIESVLFGHEKGAFTGAVSRQIGKFEHAQGGTIFLDEIGELPLPMQVKLLRVLQESCLERLGSTKTIDLDVRVIAATNANLEEAIEKKVFREDLFYRLNVVPIKIPDLRERVEDIMVLAQHFLKSEAENLGRGQLSFAQSTHSALIAHSWPGNVRELQNRIRRALGTTMDSVLLPADLGLEHVQATDTEDSRIMSLKEAREAAEKRVVQQALGLCANNISQAAKLLEISRPTLHDLLNKHGISTNP